LRDTNDKQDKVVFRRKTTRSAKKRKEKRQGMEKTNNSLRNGWKETRQGRHHQNGLSEENITSAWGLQREKSREWEGHDKKKFTGVSPVNKSRGKTDAVP